jgi:antitoxin HicB
MTLTYNVILTLEPDESAVNVQVPAMPGVLTWGATIDEAMTAAQEAISLHLESYVERGQPFPANRKPRGQSVAVTVEAPEIEARQSA